MDREFIVGHLWVGGRLWSDRGGPAYLTPICGPQHGRDLEVPPALMAELLRWRIVHRTCHSSQHQRRHYHLRH